MSIHRGSISNPQQQRKVSVSEKSSIGSPIGVNMTEVLQSSFVDAAYHAQVKIGLQAFPISSSQLRKLLSMSFGVICAKGIFTDELKKELEDNTQMSDIFFAIYYITVSAVRTRVLEKKLSDDMKAMTFTPELVKEFLSLLNQERATLEAAIKTQCIHLPGFSSLDWRVDVTISTTQLQRVLKPSVIFQLTTTDGKITTFEASIEKFHQFRYNVASLLAACQNVENHPTLQRIQG